MSNTDELKRLRGLVKDLQAELDDLRRRCNAGTEEIARLKLKVKTYERPDAVSSNVKAPADGIYNAPAAHNNPHRSRPAPSCSPIAIRRSPESQQSPGFDFIHHDPTELTDAGKKRSRGSGSEQAPKKRRYEQRWKAAGRSVVMEIEQGVFCTNPSRPQVIEQSQLQGSPYENGKGLAQRAASTLQYAADKVTVARIELFFFLSVLRVLKDQHVFSQDQVLEFMNVLDSKSDSWQHRSAILRGTKWFRKEIISRLVDAGWTLDDALTAVALASPIALSNYEHVMHKDNVDMIVDAFEKIKCRSNDFEHTGRRLVRYVQDWVPSIKTEDISEHLYGNKDLIRLQECNDSGIHKEVQQLEAAVHGNETETMSRRPLESALSLQPHGQMVLSVSPRDITDRARDMSANEKTPESQIHEAFIHELGKNPCMKPSFRRSVDSSDASICEMLRSIVVHFERMLSDNPDALFTPENTKLCSEFDSYCFTGTKLLAHGCSVKFRQTMNRASKLLPNILQSEHPRTLACFFEVFIHFIQNELPHVTRILCCHIGKLCKSLFPKGHLLGRICQLLGELDSHCLDQTLARAWECIADTFDSKLGASKPLAVSVRLDYIKRIVGATDHPKEEQLLQDILARLERAPRISTPRVMLNLAHNFNKQGRHNEAASMSQQVTELLDGHAMYFGKVVERIECLKILSHAQYKQRDSLAEQTLQEAIRMVVNQWGEQHAWVLEFKTEMIRRTIVEL